MAQGEARYRLVLDSSNFQKNLENAKHEWEAFTSTLSSGIGFGGGFKIGEKLAESFLGVGPAIADTVKHLVEYSDHLDHISKQTGIGVEALQKFAYAGKLSDISVDEMSAGMAKMQKAIANNVGAFEQLGLSTQSLRKLSADAAFDTIISRIREINDATGQTAAALEIFGKGGAPFLRMKEGLGEASAEAQKLGLVLSSETIEAAAQLDQQGKRLDATWEVVRLRFAAAVVQTGLVGTAMNALQDVLSQLNAAVQNTAPVWAEWAKTGINAVTNGLVNMARNAGPAMTLLFEAMEKVKNFNLSGAMRSLGAMKNLEFTYTDYGAMPGGKPAAAQTGSRQFTGEAGRAKEMEEWKKQNEEIVADMNARTKEHERLYKEQTNVALQETERLIAEQKRLDKEEFNVWAEAAKGKEEMGRAMMEALFAAEQRNIDETRQLADAFVNLGDSINGAAGTAISALGGMMRVMTTIHQSALFKEQGKQMSGAQKFAAGVGAAGTLIDIWQNSPGGAKGAFQGMTRGSEAGAAFGGAFGPQGAVIGGVIGGVAGGLIGLFRHPAWQKAQKEAAKILGRDVPEDMAKAILEESKKTGKSVAEVAKKYQLDELRQQETARRSTMEQGLQMAMQGAQTLMGLMEKMSDPAKAAGNLMIAAVQQALAKAGMGWMATGALAKNEQFGAAQSGAGAMGQIIAGMRQAGMVDTGLMAAAGAGAGALRDQAIQAALASGMTQAEAEKAGTAAIAPLLREQMNAAAASGRELDANTKALLEEAKKNGIEILADPAYQQLDELKGIRAALEGGAKPRSNVLPFPTTQGDTVTSAGGFGPGLLKHDTMFLAHAGEHVGVWPRGKVVKFRSALRGYGEGDELRDRPRGGGGTGTPADMSAPGATPADIAAMVAESILPGLIRTVQGQTPSISVVHNPTISISGAGNDAEITRSVNAALRDNRDNLLSRIQGIARRASRSI